MDNTNNSSVTPNSQLDVSGVLPSSDWISARWRPAMGWMYMAVCVFDFIVFPIFWTVAQGFMKNTLVEWEPLTLKSTGLFHFAMGAVLGINAWSRGQEKMTAMNTTITSDSVQK
jgi:hypothetical protein